MKRKYVVKNVGNKLSAQKLNALISVSRRVNLEKEIADCVNQMKETSPNFKDKTLNEVVNYIVADWFFLTSNPVKEKKMDD